VVGLVGELDLAEEMVDDVDHELLFCYHVGVERGGARVQAFGGQVQVERGCSDFVEKFGGSMISWNEQAGRPPMTSRCSRGTTPG
jgi:hypothetical protein